MTADVVMHCRTIYRVWRELRAVPPFRVFELRSGTMIDRSVIQAAARINVKPQQMLPAVEAVSITRRGSTDWSEHDVKIAESCLCAFLDAHQSLDFTARPAVGEAQLSSSRSSDQGLASAPE